MNEKRKDELKNVGFDMDAFIAMGIPAGTKVTIDLPDGKKKEIEVLLDKIENIDVIREDPYYSRWTMAQVFDILTSKESVTEYLRGKFSHPYRYQFTQTLERLKEINKLPSGQRKDVLSKFFTPELAMSLARGYLDDLRKYIENLPKKNHKRTPYKCIPGIGAVHCKDIEGVVFRKLEAAFDKMQEAKWRNPYRFASAFADFIKAMVKFPDKNLKLNDKFLAAYQGRGAYLTAAGLVEFHGCRVYSRKPGRYSWIRGEKDAPMSKADSLKAIHEKVDEIYRHGQRWVLNDPAWYQLWGFMKELIEDNGFDFYAAMAKKYR